MQKRMEGEGERWRMGGEEEEKCMESGLHQRNKVEMATEHQRDAIVCVPVTSFPVFDVYRLTVITFQTSTQDCQEVGE